MSHWAAIKFEQSLKYHRLAQLKFIAQPHYDKAGRPRQDEQPTRITYSVQATLVPNPEVIEVEMTRVGRFIAVLGWMRYTLTSLENLSPTLERGFDSYSPSLAGKGLGVRFFCCTSRNREML
jgi:hypothetical protein